MTFYAAKFESGYVCGHAHRQLAAAQKCGLRIAKELNAPYSGRHVSGSQGYVTKGWNRLTAGLPEGAHVDRDYAYYIVPCGTYANDEFATLAKTARGVQHLKWLVKNGHAQPVVTYSKVTYAQCAEATLRYVVDSALPQPITPVAKPEPKATQPAAKPTLEDLIRDIAGNSVDEETVRTIATTAANDALEQAKKDGAFSGPPGFEVRNVDAGTVKVIDGRAHSDFEECLAYAQQREHVLLVGPAGTGKGVLARQVAEALDADFGSIACSMGMSESHLLGRLLPTGENGQFEYTETPFVHAYENGGVFLIDEIDAADANVLIILNDATSNGHLVIPNRIDNPVAKRHPDFILIAAANTYGRGANRVYVGRNALDGATLDRFVVIDMDYDRDLERSLVQNGDLLSEIWRVRDKVNEHRLRRVVSMRFAIRAAKLTAAGVWDQKKAMVKLTAGWSDDEKQKVGV